MFTACDAARVRPRIVPGLAMGVYQWDVGPRLIKNQIAKNRENGMDLGSYEYALDSRLLTVGAIRFPRHLHGLPAAMHA